MQYREIKKGHRKGAIFSEKRIYQKKNYTIEDKDFGIIIVPKDCQEIIKIAKDILGKSVLTLRAYNDISERPSEST